VGRSKRNTGSDLGARVIVAIPAAIVAVVLIEVGGTVFAALALILGILAFGELCAMYERVRPVRLAGFVTLIGFAVATPTGPSATARMSLTAFGAFWIGFAIAHAILLRQLPHGEAIIIDVLVGTFIGDSGAYLGGRALGTRKLAPSISPNKTVEGLVIGMITAVLSVIAAGLYQDWLSLGQSALLGLAVAVMAPLGDLFESQVKRDAGTKDTGRLFGAHGGALDRLDAVLFSLPAAFYVWSALL
jgi:phosphatidate cytidylyltransferase